MITQPCPRCDRLDAVAKVSSIVSGGTQINDSASFKMTPSIGDDGGIEWSLNYKETVSVSQSVLAAQLTFPAKGKAAMEWCWPGFVVLLLFTVICIFDMKESAAAADKGGWVREVAKRYEFSQAIFVASLVCAMALLFIAIKATRIHNSGRSYAFQVWSDLYYCFRDDVVYVPGNPTQCAPSGSMRTELLCY